MTSMENVNRDPLFREAVGFGKSIAKLREMKELTPSLILAGLVIGISKRSVAYPELVSRLDDIKSAISGTGLSIDDDAIMAIDDKMPVSDSLRTILSKNFVTLSTLVDALLDYINPVGTIRCPEYAEILAYASAIAESKNAATIKPELFTVAAHIAFIHGRFVNRQVLSNLIISNNFAIAALINHMGINEETSPVNQQALKPLSDELISAFVSNGADDDRLISAIDVGLKIGHKLLSEAAVAYHEAGHAVVSVILRPSLPVTKITIKVTGDSDGATHYDPTAPYWDQSQTRGMLLGNLTTLLAGRAAQLIKFGGEHIDAGASSDIEAATREAWRGIVLFGLDFDFGLVNLDTIAKLQGQASGWLFDFAQRRVQETINEAARHAETILKANWAQVETIVLELMKSKELSGSEFSDNLTQGGLKEVAGAQEATSRPIKRRARIASTPGILRTPEGPVRYNQGDVLMTEDDGSSWPVSKTYFDNNYDVLKKAENDGVLLCEKKCRHVLALQLNDRKRLDLSHGRGLLAGQAGDWLIDYGNGELSIVRKEQFSTQYQINEKVEAGGNSSTL